MHAPYDDITSRIAEAPSWADENGVPRYSDFTPRALADIYADECVLLEIACQDCARRHQVALSSNRMRRLTSARKIGLPLTGPADRPLADAIAKKTIGYGDPPNWGHEEGCAGPTMTSDAVRVLQYWSRHDPLHTHAETGAILDAASYLTWKRDPALEIVIDPDLA